jgi:hypothetical protein
VHGLHGGVLAKEGPLVSIAITEADASILRDVLDARLTDLRREISHADSPRFRDTLSKVESALHLRAQLPQPQNA